MVLKQRGSEKSELEQLISQKVFQDISKRILENFGITEIENVFEILNKIFDTDKNIITNKEKSFLKFILNDEEFLANADFQKKINRYIKIYFPEILNGALSEQKPLQYILDIIQNKLSEAKVLTADKIVFKNGNTYVYKNKKIGIYSGGNFEDIKFYDISKVSGIEDKKNTLKVVFHGTRGSISVSGPEHKEFGGCTTCVQLLSEKLPPKTALFIDAGTGILKAVNYMREQDIENVIILSTHLHTDHSIGLLAFPFFYSPKMNFKIYGPQNIPEDPSEKRIYSLDGIKKLMDSDLHPINFEQLASKVSGVGLNPESDVVIINKKLGVKVFDRTFFEKNLPFGKIETAEGDLILTESLIIRTIATNHPASTSVLSYRIDDGMENKFVFLTDHENTEVITGSLLNHILGAKLLVTDCQYSRKKYDRVTKSWGHSTPDYVAQLAKLSAAKLVGITHHDWESTDANIKEILLELISQTGESDAQFFACKDGQSIDL